MGENLALVLEDGETDAAHSWLSPLGCIACCFHVRLAHLDISSGLQTKLVSDEQHMYISCIFHRRIAGPVLFIFMFMMKCMQPGLPGVRVPSEWRAGRARPLARRRRRAVSSSGARRGIHTTRAKAYSILPSRHSPRTHR